MGDELKQILNMLAEGKVNAEDAEKLIKAAGLAGGGDEKPGPKAKRKLRVKVIDPDGNAKVNLSLPLGVAKWGLKLMPAVAADKLREKGISSDDIVKMLENVDEVAGEEKLVDIEDGDKKIVIYIE